jgi:hypothetical protein
MYDIDKCLKDLECSSQSINIVFRNNEQIKEFNSLFGTDIKTHEKLTRRFRLAVRFYKFLNTSCYQATASFLVGDDYVFIKPTHFAGNIMCHALNGMKYEDVKKLSENKEITTSGNINNKLEQIIKNKREKARKILDKIDSLG